MQFTDDDLKRLHAEYDEMGSDKIDALIARLKAAEDFMFADEDSYDEKFERWKKAAGK